MNTRRRAIDISEPGTFDLVPGDPMYWTELLSYTYLKNLYNLKVAGFEFRQPEFTTPETLENQTVAIQDQTEILEDGLIIPPEGPSRAWLQYMPSDEYVGLMDIVDINDGYWTAQNSAITTQTTHLNWLKGQLEEDASGNTGVVGVLKMFGKWIGMEVVKNLIIGEIIEKRIPGLDALGEIGDDIADIIAGGLVESVIWLIDYFEQKASPNVKRCEALIAENNAALTLALSDENYKIRQAMLNNHQEIITQLEGQLVEREGKLIEVVKFITDIIKLFLSDNSATTSEEEEEEDGWDTVISSTSTAIDKLDDWINEVETKDDSNLPVPSAPSLPSIPASGKKAVTRKITFLLAHYGFKLATELIRKQRETDTHMTDLVQAMKDLHLQLSDIADGVNDLKFNGVRFHAQTGDVIELTGIGTVAESYDK